MVKFNSEDNTMKKITLFVAAFAAFCACQKNEMPVDSQAAGETVTITAGATVGDQTKVTMGDKSGEIYPVSWNESGERVFLREVARDTDPAKTTTVDTGSVGFSKIDAHKARLVFKLAALTKEVIYDYAAVYPCHPDGIKNNLDHGVRQGGLDAKNRVSYILNHEKSQVPLEDRPDPATHIMMATDLNHSSQATSLDLDFKYVVAFGKMTLKNFPALAAGETVSKITITAPESQKMTGRMFHYYHENTDGSHNAGDIIPYSKSTVKNYVMLDPQNITFNTAGFDIWFTTYPIALAQNDTLVFSVETNKKTYAFSKILSKALAFTAGSVSEFTVDYSKCLTPYKTLTFDFSTCPAGWPGEASYKTKNDKAEYTYDYVLDKVTYKFTCAPCNDLASTSTRSIAWGWDGTKAVEYFVAQSHRFLGLPAIEGYKLVTVKFTQILAGSKTARQACITTAITAQKGQADACVNGGEAIQVNSKDTEFTFNLTGTAANTRYYFAPCVSASGFNTMTLTYEKVDQ